MATPATVSEILDAVALELDINLTTPKMQDALLWWLNVVYPTVLDSEEFSWRKRDVPLILYPPGTCRALLENGNSTFTALNRVGLGTWSQRGHLVVPGHDGVYPMSRYSSGLSLTLESPFLGSTGSYTATIYHSRYEITDLQEDWITGVYLQGKDVPLSRVYPRDSNSVFQYYKKNTGAPQAFYTEGRTATGDTVLGVIPAPDTSYACTVRALLGSTPLLAETASTIIPPPYDKLVLVYGVCLLYCTSHKDVEGIAEYKDKFGYFIGKLGEKTRKEPGRAGRLIGHLQRTVGWDPEIPLDWKF